ncbi:MAG: HAD hydrolase-like protein [Elusimicrobia bacterium]|nr:HAD hydrolase-like protein [Elusimicrobiota bacterium]
MNSELILFDFGGVLAPEGFQLGILILSRMFSKTYKEMYEIVGYEAGLRSGYTAGKTGESVFWKTLSENLGIKDDLASLRYVFLDNFQPRKDMLELVSELKDTYRLGIFSDQTNWIYELDEKYDFFRYFDCRFISYDLGFTKHDSEFYRIPSEKTGIDPASILVVDDKPRVVDNCIKAGMLGYLFTSVSACREYLAGMKTAIT